MLAIVHFSSLFGAVLVGWIMSVVLHEFAHGIVAYWGGDYTIRERGGLTLNPLQYVDPVMSIILPIIFLYLGAVPLPGGSTYVRRDLLRGKQWDTAVSLAGPAMNLLLFVGCALPLHPAFGWASSIPSEWTPGQLTLGALAFLQFLSVVLNLIPVPPLDGFQAISPWLPQEFRSKVSMPPWNIGLFILLFLVLSRVPIALWVFVHLCEPLLGLMGFDELRQEGFYHAFYRIFAG
jgi:Zn-dependent protease